MKFIIKILLIAHCLLLTANFTFSQNLVFNGSFEIRDSIFQNSDLKYHNCPYSTGDGPNAYNPQLEMAKGWSDPEGKYTYYYETTIDYYSTSDFFHSCGNNSANLPYWVSASSVSVPHNTWLTGFQYPRTGEGYSGFGFYGLKKQYSDIDCCEYIQTKLSSKLQKDIMYKFVFYVNRGDRCSHSIETQGAYFSSNKISYPSILNGLKNNSVVAQIINNNGFISDTINWTKIEGIFQAKGDEEYLTIGSFDVRKNMARFEHIAVYHNLAAYAVDDISLYPVNAPIEKANCGNDTTICYGNSFSLGTTNVKPEYRNEYTFEWYVLGKKDSIFSTEGHPVVYPETTTTYIVKVMDFKFDKSTDTITVNVVDCTEPTSLLVYPNPTNALVNFKFNSPIPEQLKIELYDVIGRKIRSTSFQQNYDIKEVQMNLFDLASGMYFYSVVVGGEKKFVGKIVKIE